MRSSWRMFARNSLLVLRGQRELLGALLQHLPRLLDLDVLGLDVAVLLASSVGLLLQLGVGALQRLLPALQLGRPLPQLPVSCCDCSSSSSVRALATMVLTLTPIISASWSRKSRWIWVKRLKRGQLDHAEHLVLEQHRQHDHLTGGASPSPEEILR